MSKLVVPKLAYRFRKKGKWHLVNPRADIGKAMRMTVCKFILHDDSPNLEVSSVSKLETDDFCAKCLGPLDVEGGK